MDADTFLKHVLLVTHGQLYCYILRRPSGEPFYVGIGRGSRAVHHERSAYQKRFSRQHKSRLIRKLHSRGLSVVYELAGVFSCRGDAERRERELIAKYGRRDIRRGSLVNLTDGGDGSAGRIFSSEAREAIGARHRGKPTSPETRHRLSEIAKRRLSNPLERARLKELAMRGTDPARRAEAAIRAKAEWQKPEFREKIRLSRVGVWTSELRRKVAMRLKEIQALPEAKEAKRTAANRFWSDPEYRSRHAAAMSTSMASDRMRQKIKAGVARVMADEDHRHSLSEAAKARWADPERRAALLAARSTKEVREKMAAARRGKQMSGRTRRLLRERNLGKSQSEETKAKRRQPIEVRGRPYASAAEAAAALGVGKRTVVSWLASGPNGAIRLDRGNPSL